MPKTVDQLLRELTLEEKASLCSGKDFWTTKAVDRLGIPSWTMTDGPHGLRKQASGENAGILGAIPSTCFPSGAGLASTWNRDLIEEVGRALGREAKAEQVGVLLGPAVNIKRSPLCGRNFEYFSEDPYLAGQMAKHHILGVQSQGIGTSLKHFAANNQEKDRMTIDAVVDERTLREIYLPAFETAVKEAQPWTVMSAYNRLNGTYASQNRWLLTQVLKEEWGHTGLVVTDWGACDDRAEGIKAGNELEMPGNGGLTDADIVKAVKNKTLPLADLDRAVRRLLELTLKVAGNLDPQAVYDAEAHHALARRAAAESMVLLKNDGGLLPLQVRRVALVGAFARTPRYQGGGSSHITPTRMDDAVEECRKAAAPGVEIHYAAGYSLKSEASDQALLDEARELSRGAEAVVVFLGLTDPFESEGYDRTHLGIPANHTALLEEVLKVQKNVVVVLSNGSPIEMPWADRVPAILEGYLGGQAWGGAAADLLFGRANPSGKLAETFPIRLEDTPSYLNFPGDAAKVEYREGVFVGYRHFDAVKAPVLFPFGHGLSYTVFQYGPLALSKDSLFEDQPLTVTLEVTNAGPAAGAEVVQFYVAPPKGRSVRPVRELRAFAKVFLEPGETRAVSVTLGRRAWALWSTEDRGWVTETGSYEIAAGASSRDLRSRAAVTVRSTAKDRRRYDQNSRLGDLADHPVGGIFVRAVMAELKKTFGSYEPGSAEERMMDNMVAEMPLRNLVRFSGGKVPPAVLSLLLGVLNGLQPFSVLERFIPTPGTPKRP